MQCARIPALLLTTALWFGAAQVQAPSAATPAFEVASIKLSNRNRPSLQYRLGPEILTTSSPLKHLIRLAYDVDDYQVEGCPAWAQSEFYDVEAKAGSASTPKVIKVML